MTAGRPKAFNSVEEMESLIDSYFIQCDNDTKILTDTKGNTRISYRPYTVSGLCLALDITRETLSQYDKQEEYSDTIKRAKKKIENWIEEHSLMGDTNPAVSIFNLKNNFGWVDKQEVSSTNVNLNQDVSSLTDEELQAELAKYK